MNHSTDRGVMRMYKERRAGVARDDQFVREWILSAIGTESDAMQRGEEARGATGVDEREWETLLRENTPLAYRVARGVLRNDTERKTWRWRRCCARTGSLAGCANVPSFGAGWCAFASA